MRPMRSKAMTILSAGASGGRVTQPLAIQIGELAARLHRELAEDVREVRAHRARRDAERIADRAVRLSFRHQPDDLELTTGESFRTGRDGLHRRPRAKIVQLLARRVEPPSGPQLRE